jgi:adenine-specific DNA-methyltransferase
MRYFGSKSFTAATVETRALEFLSVGSRGGTVCDPFGGIGMIASAFKRAGWRVTVADHLLFPHYYQRARLDSSKNLKFSVLISHLNLASTAEIEAYLNAFPPLSGWITEEFSIRRGFFTPSNAAKIDAVWMEIKAWSAGGIINDHEYVFLISSLIDSFDRVANTAGTYYAYLKDKTRRALHDFKFKFLTQVDGPFDVDCRHQEAISTVDSGNFDVLYLDPPYSSRSYDRYYHLPQTVAAGVDSKAIGISGVPDRLPIKSKFESPRTAERALSDLVDAARCSILMVQYADGGLISLDRIKKILEARGSVNETRINTIGYTTQHHSRATQHSLFVVTDA